MLNNICVVGRMVRDPELREGSVQVCKFTVACDRDKDHTDFIPCVSWRKQAEFVSKYFKKGSLIAVEGRLENNQYERNGERKEGWQINVARVNFCGSAPKKETPLGEAKPQSVFYEEPDDAGELPF